MTEMQLKYLAHEETKRHNAAVETVDAGKLGETARSNRANEELKAQGIEIDRGKLAELERDNAHYRTTDSLKTAASTTKDYAQAAKNLSEVGAAWGDAIIPF